MVLPEAVRLLLVGGMKTMRSVEAWGGRVEAMAAQGTKAAPLGLSLLPHCRLELAGPGG